MKFFKFKDLIQSWSVWVLGVVTVTPVLNDNTTLFTFIPDEYKPIAITVLGLLGLAVRAVKQVNALKASKN